MVKNIEREISRIESTIFFFGSQKSSNISIYSPELKFFKKFPSTNIKSKTEKVQFGLHCFKLDISGI